MIITTEEEVKLFNRIFIHQKKLGKTVAQALILAENAVKKLRKELSGE